MRLDVEIRPGSTEGGPGQLVATFRLDAYLDDPRLPGIGVSSPLDFAELEGHWKEEARAHIVANTKYRASLKMLELAAKLPEDRRRFFGLQLEALALEFPPRLDRAIAGRRKGVRGPGTSVR